MNKNKFQLLILSSLLSLNVFAANDSSAEKYINFGAAPTAQVAPIAPPATDDKNTELTKTHEELRNLLKTVVDSINSGKYENMNSVLSKDIEATPIDSEYLVGAKAINTYFQEWFGQNGKIKSLNMSMTPNKLTWLHESGTIGIVSGIGVEKYVLKDGSTYDFKTRWTATVVKEDGAWKMRTFNSSVNFLDNPLLTEIQTKLKGYIPLAGFGGLLIGLIIGVFVGKRKCSKN